MASNSLSVAALVEMLPPLVTFMPSPILTRPSLSRVAGVLTGYSFLMSATMTSMFAVGFLTA